MDENNEIFILLKKRMGFLSCGVLDLGFFLSEMWLEFWMWEMKVEAKNPNHDE